MLTFWKLTYPVKNNEVVLMNPMEPKLKQWLAENFTNFDADSYDQSVIRHLAFVDFADIKYHDYSRFDPISRTLVFAKKDNVTETEWPVDSEFDSYFQFFLHHPSWDESGSFEKVTFQNIYELPNTWEENYF